MRFAQEYNEIMHERNSRTQLLYIPDITSAPHKMNQPMKFVRLYNILVKTNYYEYLSNARASAINFLL